MKIKTLILNNTSLLFMMIKIKNAIIKTRKQNRFEIVQIEGKRLLMLIKLIKLIVINPLRQISQTRGKFLM